MLLLNFNPTHFVMKKLQYKINIFFCLKTTENTFYSSRNLFSVKWTAAFQSSYQTYSIIYFSYYKRYLICYVNELCINF